MTEERTTPVIEFWVRNGPATTVYERQKEVYRELQGFEETGRIDSVHVNVWGECVHCPAENDDGTDVAFDGDLWATYCRFEDWAAETDRDLQPAFRRCKHTSLVSTESCEVIELPLLCLAVYADAELQAVFPCSAGERLWTVEDGLALLDPQQSVSWTDFATGTVKQTGGPSGQDTLQKMSTPR